MYNRLPVTIVRGNGSRVWDSDGKEYIDMLAGIAVNSVGHCHPSVVQAIQEQSARLMHITNIFTNDVQAEFTQLLTKTSGFDKAYFCNSGLEANEGAIKLVRKHGERTGKKGPIISFTGCFHGRSIASISMGKEKQQQGFGPLPEGFEILPFNDVNALESRLDKDVKAVFVEAIQGEGGIRLANPDFMESLSALCLKNNILIVCDEVQTGMGRTGKLFGYQHYAFQPDIITLAKGLGAGFPIGAVLTSNEIASTFSFGDHGTTFGGNPLACASAMASLNIILNENLIEASKEKGEYLLNQLKNTLADFPCVVDIRGKGLMIGIELSFPARPVVINMLKRGFIINATDINTLRMVPPFVVTYDEMDEIIKHLPDAIMEENQS